MPLELRFSYGLGTRDKGPSYFLNLMDYLHFILSTVFITFLNLEMLSFEILIFWHIYCSFFCKFSIFSWFYLVYCARFILSSFFLRTVIQ